MANSNFRAFAATDERYTPEADMHRSIFGVTLERQGPLLVFEIRGSGFLKHMVRNLVGALMEVGVGNLTERQLKEMRSTGIRSAGIRTVPPSGLFLVNVNY